MQYKIRHISSDAPTETIEAPSLLRAARIYCQNNRFDLPVDARHCTEDVFTLLSASKTANVIGNFDICLEHSNLTRAGMGQPKKGLKRVELTLSPEVINRLDELADQQGWKRNYTVEELLRYTLGMPSHYGEDMHLILEGKPVE